MSPDTVHGVLLDVEGMGVLIRGSPGVGKSTLALSLIDRGHRLVADDAPLLSRSEEGRLVGRVAESVRGFLNIRGLGLLNIEKLYGPQSLKESAQLELVIELSAETSQPEVTVEALMGERQSCRIADIELPQLTLYTQGPGDLALLTETAVRDEILRRSGYNAADDLTVRQSREMKK